MLKILISITVILQFHWDAIQSLPDIKEGRQIAPQSFLSLPINTGQSCSTFGPNYQCKSMVECLNIAGSTSGMVCGVFMVCCGLNMKQISTTAAPASTISLPFLADALTNFFSAMLSSQPQNIPLFTPPPNQINNIPQVFFPGNTNFGNFDFNSLQTTPAPTAVAPAFWEECGRPQIFRSAKIVGGTTATYGEFPWQVILFINGDPRCGGALIGKEWVVTAAHCVNNVPESSIVARLGDYNTHDANPFNGRTDRTILRKIVHPQFNIPKPYANDLCILQLNQPVTYQMNIKPVCLPPFQSYAGYVGTISGFGKERYGARKDEVPAIIQKARLPVMTNDYCQTLYQTGGANEIIYDFWLCAGYKEGGTDACQGDSGGPLVTFVNGAWALIGLVSWGYGCAFPNFPGVYTNITMYKNWIESQIYATTG